MKVKAPSLLKKILAALSSKTNELRIRIMIFFLLHKNNIDKSTLTHKLHVLVSHHHPHHNHHLKKMKKNDDEVVTADSEERESQQEEVEEGYDYDGEEEESKASLLMYYYNKVAEDGGGAHTESVVEDVVFPREVAEVEENLTHVLFKDSEAAMVEEEGEEEVVADGRGVAADVKNVVAEVEAEEDIDQAADLFIKRFKQQIQLQKQYSLERNHQMMLQATV